MLHSLHALPALSTSFLRVFRCVAKVRTWGEGGVDFFSLVSIPATFTYMRL